MPTVLSNLLKRARQCFRAARAVASSPRFAPSTTGLLKERHLPADGGLGRCMVYVWPDKTFSAGSSVQAGGEFGAGM